MENKKIKLTHKLWAKILAIFLLVLFAAASCFSVTALWCAEDIGSLSGTYDPRCYEASIRWATDLSAHFGYWWIAFAALSLIIFVALLVFLCCAAGHRGESDEIFLNPFDRLPFDLYAAGGGLVCFLMLMLLIELSYYGSEVMTLLLMGLLIIVAGLVALAVLLSLVTRVKHGAWWRNTLLYRLVRLLWRCLKAVWSWMRRTVRGISEALPIVWRTALIAALAIIAELLLTVGTINGDGALILLWLLYNLFIFAALCFGAFQMKSLKAAGEKLAAGDMSYKLSTDKMYWEFKKHGEALNSIARGMSAAVEERMKSERLKTELITNVSHDIKTPLTSIVSYVDLLQKEHTEEQESEYLEVLARQSARLKKLTEDLVEASKASTGSIAVNLAPTNTTEIINQSLGEYAEKLSAGHLEVVAALPEPPVSAMADGRLLWRVLDNLLNNVCKYSLGGTRVYVEARERDGMSVISVKNVSRSPLNISSGELMERFVRGDSSRSTEGSGLGLNIAQSLTELQKGHLDISIDGDLFKAEIILPKA